MIILMMIMFIIIIFHLSFEQMEESQITSSAEPESQRILAPSKLPEPNDPGESDVIPLREEDF